MNSIRLFKTGAVSSRSFYPRYYSLFTNIKQNVHCYKHSSRRINRASYLKTYLKPLRCISNCSSMQTKDSESDKSDDEKMQKVLEDEEFRNILKDFANDFGVDSETNALLHDIRKNIDKDHEKNNLSKEKHNTNSEKSQSALGGGLHYKYKDFSDTDSKVIHSYDYNEDDAFEDETIYHINQELKPKLPYNNIKRGISGVFELADLIEVLRNESLLDVTAISIPKELHYADFLVLATAKSKRHSEAFIESLKKLYKQTKNRKDPFLKVEGEDVASWKVMDMGNIVLHIFLEETRILYDIESLWLLDSKFDTGGNTQSDPMLNIIEEQLAFFNSLQEKDSSELPKDIS